MGGRRRSLRAVAVLQHSLQLPDRIPLSARVNQDLMLRVIRGAGTPRGVGDTLNGPLHIPAFLKKRDSLWRVSMTLGASLGLGRRFILRRSG